MTETDANEGENMKSKWFKVTWKDFYNKQHTHHCKSVVNGLWLIWDGLSGGTGVCKTTAEITSGMFTSVRNSSGEVVYENATFSRELDLRHSYELSK